MSVDPLTLYKLMTLYMLNKVNFPLFSGKGIYFLYCISTGVDRIGRSTSNFI